jgi:streptomycin 3"-adenylyltransferase
MRFHSDVDVLAVTRDGLAADARADLAAGLLRLSGRHPRVTGQPRPVELTVVSQPEVRPWRYPPQVEFQYGEWLRDEVESGQLPQPHVSPDLAVLVTAVLAHSEPLLGPPPEQVLDPVPAADVVAASRDSVPQLLADLGSDTTNVLLTLARAWHTVTTGRLVSKDAGAEWALPLLPPEGRVVLAHARAVYLDLVDEDWEPSQSAVRRTAELMAARIGQRSPAHAD